MAARPVRVLHLAPMLQSGAGRMIVDIARDARALGVESAVISSGRRNPAMHDWPEYVDMLRSQCIFYDEIDLFSRDPRIVAESVAALTRALEQSPPDLIHAHSGVPAAAAHVALERLEADIPVLASFYSWGVGRPAWMDRDDLAAFQRCRRTIVISRWYEQFLLERGFTPRQVLLIPCGISASLFEVKADRAALENYLPTAGVRAPIAVILAVIEPRKNQMAALQALAAIPVDRRPRLVCIGAIKDPAYHASLLDFAREHGLQEWVGFSDFVADPFPAAAAADLFLFPSLSEGLGIAILEVMALGVPVIGNPVEGAADIIRDGVTALAIDSSDSAAFAGSIEKLMAHEQLREKLRRGARAMIEAEYLWTDTVRRTVDEYRRALASSD